MTGFIRAECPYCGGSLTHKNGSVWVCQYCGKESLLLTDAPSNVGSSVNSEKPVRLQAPAFTLTVKRKRKIINSVRLRGNFKITAVYRPRTTLADRFPMNLIVEHDDGNVTLVEEVENVGKGSLVVEMEEDGSCNLYRVGNIQYSVGKKKKKPEFFTEDSPVVIGSFEITISSE